MTTLTRIIFLLLPILIDCQMTAPQQKCLNITCPNHSSDEAACELGHIEDPFTNKCVAQCDGPCSNGHCNFCYCSFPTEEDIESAQLAELRPALRRRFVRRWRDVFASGTLRLLFGIPSRRYESPNLGYRPDVTNPRICLKIPEDSTTKLVRSCHKGFKSNDDGECVSNCGDCRNGCCGPDGVCQCWDGYELDVASSNCVTVKNDDILKMDCEDRCSNGGCDSDGVCRCSDCSDVINKTVKCQAKLNRAVYDAGGLDANYNCGDTTFGEEMISKTRHNMSITILAGITAILSITMIILTYTALKMKRALPLNVNKVKILFGG
ncbi:hypothetical protein QE152_g13162 [Popillia japonica]|uniref:Uncharacterized protein n=1 Tax=Popillia japonica TaxID=7064 RepID=A0AAW1LDC9_POPJA